MRRSIRLLGGCFAFALLTACSSPPEGTTQTIIVCPSRTRTEGLPGTPSTLTEVTAFAADTAGLKMFVHVPANLPKGAPVVVAMHGCTQSAEAYAGAGWNDLADRGGFVVVYPEQETANDASRCFRWWLPAHTTRDQGEARAIAAMVTRARDAYGATGKAFVTGLSAGGAMTAVMLAAYPDVFDAGAIMAGIPYGCAKTKVEAFSCMSGKDQTPAAWGALLPAMARSNPPRVAVWQGDADWTVRPANGEALVRQWTSAHGIPAQPDATETVGPAKHVTYKNNAVELWTIAGMGHGTALDPQAGCGKAGAFMLDEKICSTSRAAQFFGLAIPDAPGTPAGPGATTPGGASSGGSTWPDPCD